MATTLFNCSMLLLQAALSNQHNHLLLRMVRNFFTLSQHSDNYKGVVWAAEIPISYLKKTQRRKQIK